MTQQARKIIDNVVLAVLLVPFLLAMTMATPNSAAAQKRGALSSGGMDLHLFRPAADSRGHFAVNGSEILPHLDFSVGLILDYGRNIFKYEGFENSTANCVDGASCGNRPAVRTSHIVENAFTGTLAANLGLFNYLTIGVQIPVGFMSGPNMTIPGHYNDGFGQVANYEGSGLNAQGIGNLSIIAKGRFLRANVNPVGLAAIVRAELPTAASDQFMGEPGFSLWPEIIAEWAPTNTFRMSLEAGYRFNSGDGATVPVNGRTCPGNTPIMSGMPIAAPTMCGAGPQPAVNPYEERAGSDLTHDDLLTFGLGVSWRVAPVLDLVLEGYGTGLVSQLGDPGSLSMEALGGLKIFVQRHSYLFVGAGAGLPPFDGYQKADFRAVLGFVFEPSIGDRDGDGYKDDVDACPDEPEDFDNFKDEDGCPEPDNDRDGILDVDDSCPMVPEDRDGDEDEDGCPEGGEGDRDGDGIPDDIDNCPDEPEDRDDFEDEDGCPDYDNDKDGIPDVDDLCPNDPEDIDNFEDEDGCPEPDNDKDRILDPDDECPNDPETYNGTDDEDGCPDRGIAGIDGNSIFILEKIYFETDSAVIKRESYDVVDAVAATLNGNPQITKMEIQGHADERGADDYNIKLTRDRAASVMEALAQRGVDRARMRSGGYGERCPIDHRSNKKAWEKNRRVEFKILETEEGPTGVEVACPKGRSLIPK